VANNFSDAHVRNQLSLLREENNQMRKILENLYQQQTSTETLVRQVLHCQEQLNTSMMPMITDFQTR
jgi:uncharacterized protein YigA (DUF484 family)